MEFLRFVLLGLGIGGTYALAAQGMVLTYRGSGVINLAQGAVAGVGAYSYYEATSSAGLAPWLAVVVATVICAAVGVAIHLLIMRPLRHSTALIRLIATTGVLTVLQQVLQLRFGDTLQVMKALLPSRAVKFGSSLSISEDRLWLLGIAVVLSGMLALFYRYHRLGVATTALAENELVTAAHGWSPGRIAVFNWLVGCGLAGLAGALLGPVQELTPTSSTLLVVPALAAALVGGFRSFPLTLVGGLLIGVGQSLLALYVTTPGWGNALPFLVVIVVLVVRGQAMHLRRHVFERQPRVGDPRTPTWFVLALAAVAVAVTLGVASASMADAITTSAATAIVGLSVVVVVGYAGQLSLAQFALAGIGALVASRMVAVWGVSFWVGALGALIVAVPIGLIVAIPALRTRGVNLAIATFGLAVAVESIVLSNTKFTGGVFGTSVPPPTLFGLSLDPIAYPERYATLCLAGFVAAALCVRNLRQGPGGRRLIAVRSNERAAASLGIGVVRTKLYGFAVGSVLAAFGGVLLAFHTPSVVFTQFSSLGSIQIVVLVVIGGVGYVMGSAQGCLIAAGGLGTVVIGDIFDFGRYVLLVGGLLLLVTLVTQPDGITLAVLRSFARLLPHWPGHHRSASQLGTASSADKVQLTGKRLTVAHLDVRFGSIRPVQDVSFHVEPGEIVGLIGPNGAGKTTCIDMISGFTRGSGSVSLDDRDLSSASASTRARSGIGRSFQSLELFEDETVWENLASATDSRLPFGWGRDLVKPRRPVLSHAALTAVELFGLRPHLDDLASSLPTGTRRVLAIARALAGSPSVLLLDEPAAGLDERESAELGTLLRTVARDWTVGVLLVEHDMGLVMGVCDRVVVLDAGRVIADGTPREVAQQPAVVAAYLGSNDAEADVPELEPASAAASRAMS